jgi:hypothetical protein
MSSEVRRYGYGVDPDTAYFNENIGNIAESLRQIRVLEEGVKEKEALAAKKKAQECGIAYEALTEARMAVRRHRDESIRAQAAKELAVARRQVAAACPRGKR